MQTGPRRELSLFDSTCLILGIIVGVGIYQMPPDIARGAGGAWGVLCIWALGGMLSLCGAFGYAELATAYPRQGGDYVYLGKAYGRWAGFLFGWVQLAVVRPGDIAVMAFAFAIYARVIIDPLLRTAVPHADRLYAALAVALLTLVNVLGARGGKWTQNLLTVAKVVGLLAIVAVALASPGGGAVAERAAVQPFPVSLALIFVLFTFGGWNEMAYVAAEVKRPERNIARALVIGTLAVTALYVLVNAAFLRTLGYAGLANSKAVAADSIATVFPRAGARLISLLVCVSALGAVNGLIYAGSRISYALGSEYGAFRWLGRWHGRSDSPVGALVVQGTIAVGLVLALGSFVNTVLYTAAAVYAFYLATSVAVIVLRRREPEVKRPFRATGYPVTTLIFCGVCVFLIHSAVTYKPWIAAASGGIILLGLPLYGLASLYGSVSRPGRSGEPE